MNGGVGFGVAPCASTLATRPVDAGVDAIGASTSSTRASCVSSRVAALLSSLLVRRPATSRAANGGGAPPSSRASTVQYSSGTNAWISRSRSTMMRTATDCTRPADSPRRTFSQSSGADLVADQPVEDAARLLRVDAVAVESRAGARSPRCTARLRDLVERARGGRSRFGALRAPRAMCQAIASPSRSGSGAR